MNEKFTPGPWNMQKDPGHICEECQTEDYEAYVVGVKGDGIAIVLTDKREEANAHLITAAPDLYMACAAAASILGMAEKYAEAGGRRGPEQREYDEAAPLIRAALAKARGES